jgi:hypothetical protein
MTVLSPDTAQTFVRSNKSKRILTVGNKALYTHTYKGTIGHSAIVTFDEDGNATRVLYYVHIAQAYADLNV